MPKLSLQTRIRLMQIYYANGNSLSRTLRFYGQETNNYQVCSQNALRSLIRKFEEFGSVADRKSTGRPRMSDDDVMEIDHAVQTLSQQTVHGDTSTRAISNITGIPLSSVWKAMRKIMKLHPYRIQTLHELKVGDPDRRIAFARDFLPRAMIEDDWLETILWTDEANFTLTGQVNSWNTRIWATENPHQFVQEPLYQKKMTVWCGFTANFIIGPYFYLRQENGQLVPETVNGERYHRMLTEFVIPGLDDMQVLEETTWMQDGAPPHFSRQVTDLLIDEFQGRVIARGFDFPWPARSPDLTPMDFFFWPYVKEQVYRQGDFHSFFELRRAITRTIERIHPVLLRKAVFHSLDRAQAIMNNNGGHIEHLLN